MHFQPIILELSWGICSCLKCENIYFNIKGIKVRFLKRILFMKKQDKTSQKNTVGHLINIPTYVHKVEKYEIIIR